MGNFATYRGVAAPRIVKILPTGLRDTSFDMGSGFNMNANKILVQNNEIWVLGDFTTYQDTMISSIVKLNQNGSIDNSFSLDGEISGQLYDIKIDSFGNILLAGDFMFSNQTNLGNQLIRLLSNGEVDNNWNWDIEIDGFVTALDIDDSQNIVLAGEFLNVDQTSAGRFCRLNQEGIIEPEFTTGVGFNDFVNTLLVDDQGNYILGGRFTSFNQQGKNRLARIFGGEILSHTDFQALEVKAFPNPTTDYWQISAKDEIQELRLIDSQGKLIWIQSNQTNDFLVDAHHLATGIYFLHVTSYQKTNVIRLMKN